MAALSGTTGKISLYFLEVEASAEQSREAQ